MQVRHNVPSFVGVLELPGGWDEAAFSALTEDMDEGLLDRREGTLYRHRGMPTTRDRLWHERWGGLALPVPDKRRCRWDALLPGDPGVGHGPGILSRIELRIPEGVDALAFSFSLGSGRCPALADIEALVEVMDELATRFGSRDGRADVGQRFLCDGDAWYWQVDGPTRDALTPLHLQGPFAAFDPDGWPQRVGSGTLRGDAAVAVVAGFDAGRVGWSDAWLADQEPGSVDYASWQERFASEYNENPRIPGTRCHVGVRHRELIIGLAIHEQRLRWHETGTAEVHDAAAAIESMQRRLTDAGVGTRAAIHVVAEVDDGD